MTNILNAEFHKLRFNIGLKLLPSAAVIMSLAITGFMIFASDGAAVEGKAFAVTNIFGFEPAGRFGAMALTTLSNSQVPPAKPGA
jgi:hypothetical protein